MSHSENREITGASTDPGDKTDLWKVGADSATRIVIPENPLAPRCRRSAKDSDCEI